MRTLLLLLAVLFSSVAHSAEPFIPVLMYHHVSTTIPPGDTVVSLSSFREQIQWLKAEGYNTVTIDQLSTMLKTGTVPERTVALTFDDGWKDQLQAVAILQEYHMASTYFIVSNFFEDPRYMSMSDVQSLAMLPGVEIGAHSHTHFMEWIDGLDKMDTRIMVGELAMSKQIVEEVIGKKVKTFAWPFGYTRPGLFNLAAVMGYSSTVLVNNSTHNTADTPPMRIQRINIHGSCSLEHVKIMVVTGISKGDCNEQVDRVVQTPVR